MSGVGYITAQVAPSATTETDLYTFLTKAQTWKEHQASFVICNRGVDGTFRISLSVAGAATTAKDYLYYDTPINANDTFMSELQLTPNAGDIVRVYASHANMSFTLFGREPR